MNYTDRKITKAQLVAHVDVLLARNETLHEQLAAAQRNIIDLEVLLARAEAKVHETNAAAALITTRGELLARCKALAKQGVPCHIKGGFIIHTKSKAVLAQLSA